MSAAAVEFACMIAARSVHVTGGLVAQTLSVGVASGASAVLSTGNVAANAGDAAKVRSATHRQPSRSRVGLRTGTAAELRNSIAATPNSVRGVVPYIMGDASKEAAHQGIFDLGCVQEIHGNCLSKNSLALSDLAAHYGCILINLIFCFPCNVWCSDWK